MKKWLSISIIALCNFTPTLDAANQAGNQAVNQAITSQTANKAKVQKVSIDTVRKASQSNDPITIVDVRDAASYAKGHIRGAINLPPEKYDSFRKPRANYPGLGNGTNYVYCYHGKCALAERACRHFMSAGYKDSKEIIGGYEDWEKAGFPIDRYTNN